MDLEVLYLPILSGKQDYRTESPRAGRLHLAPLVVCAHPALGATVHMRANRGARPPLRVNSAFALTVAHAGSPSQNALLAS